MIIPLKFEDGLLYLNTWVRIRRLRVSGNVQFVIDTGSNVTLINEPDALKLEIPFKLLATIEEPRNQLGLGGGVLELREAYDVDIWTANKLERAESFNLNEILVGKSNNEGNIVEDSIIGTDFLIKKNLTLHFDPVDKEYYLETNIDS